MFKAQQLTKARKFFQNGEFRFLGPCVLDQSGTSLTYPRDIASRPAHLGPLPEIAFAGESNVGKSSLIRALVGGSDLRSEKSELVKTSRRPGHTKTVNYFLLQHKLCIVDMPGYGKNSRTEWGDAICTYLKDRTSLRKLFLLIDCRRGVKDRDKDTMELLEEIGVSYQIVLTKTDVFPEELAQFKEKVREDVQDYISSSAAGCWPEVLMTSTKTGHEMDQLRAQILACTGLA